MHDFFPLCLDCHFHSYIIVIDGYRYIVCKWKRAETETVHDYMFEVNERFEQIWGATSEKDITQIVPLDVIQSDEKFFNYIYESNES